MSFTAFVTAIVALCLLGNCVAQQQAVISVAVADLRSQPVRGAVSFGIDRLQLTQLLFGEYVEIVRYTEDRQWSWVRVPGQRVYTANSTWEPYEGYVEHHQLVQVSREPNYNLVIRGWNYVNVYNRICFPIGCLPSDRAATVSVGTLFEAVEERNGWVSVLGPPTADNGPFRTLWVIAAATNPVEVRLVPLSPSKPVEDVTRNRIVHAAFNLIGWPYCWGGRSAFNDLMYLDGDQITGLDCSGLTSLAYKTQGFLLPRDAAPQFFATKNVTGGAANLKPADMFFFASKSNPMHMTHVMMFVDQETVVESGGSPNFALDPNNGTRIVSIEQRFGAPIDKLQWGQPDFRTGSLLYWGTVF